MKSRSARAGRQAPLRERTSEYGLLAGLLDDARRGESRSLVLRGEAGIGKTALLAVETRDDLTAQERQIAELARDGLSNPQIGARLFLSPPTVEWHLRHVFGKLGIKSRRELANALPTSNSETISV
jgi:DNA-binding CsgD family transcriptional regulator